MSATMSKSDLADEVAQLRAELGELRQRLEDRIDVRAQGIVESITGVGPHQLRHFEQERHYIERAEPLPDIEGDPYYVEVVA